MRSPFILIAAAAATLWSSCLPANEKSGPPLNVIAYCPGDATGADEFPIEKLTHIIFSFCHLRGNRLAVDNEKDSLSIRHLVGLKKRNPSLKVMLSLGGWGGCKACSEVFSSAPGRQEFAQSVKALMEEYKTDGLDLDWEYPAIEGYPGHPFSPEDKANFTALVSALRAALGERYELSFAAGGFTKFLEQSIDWHQVMPMLDRVNLMTYDLVHGFSTVTGHHTPLRSTPQQRESAEHAVRFLDSIGIPKNKLVIGAAFYARVWENADSLNDGLYRPGKFKRGISFRALEEYVADNPGYELFWDSTAQAPYMYNRQQKWFATFDDSASIRLKAIFVKEEGLNGIMFWHLKQDKNKGGLLDVISQTIAG
jgi:chitinase